MVQRVKAAMAWLAVMALPLGMFGCWAVSHPENPEAQGQIVKDPLAIGYRSGE